MTARILIVGADQSLAECWASKLRAEYFEVNVAAGCGDAPAILEAAPPQVAILDATTGDADCFELCRRIKGGAHTKHIPIALITMPDEPDQRAKGLDAGADDFLVAPVSNVALFSRVKSLLRMKMMLDELMMRESVNRQLGLADIYERIANIDPAGRILVCDDRSISAAWFRALLGPKHQILSALDADNAIALAKTGQFDILVVSLETQSFDALRLCSQIRSLVEVRSIPLLVLAEDEGQKLIRAFDMGVHDYMTPQADRNELRARVRTQVRRKHYSDLLRESLQHVIEVALESKRSNQPMAG